MKKFLLFFALAFAVVSCSDKSKQEKEIEKVPIQKVTVERFDRLFFETRPEGLPKLKQRFPDLFPPGTSDAEWIAHRDQPFMKQLQAEVQKVYPDMDTIQNNIQELLQHIKYYYPSFVMPRIITMVNDNLEYRAIYNGKVIIIPLSLYLGKNNKYYQGLDTYRTQQFDPSQILPDIVTSFSTDKIAAIKDATLLSYMIYYGKLHYLKDRLIPEVPDYDKIGFTKLQLQWAKENEVVMWTYFVENKLLYSNDRRLPGNFINPAPFTKFGMAFDTDSPGRLGQWVGWQIVRSYMDNNKDVTLQQLMAMDAKTIFEKSKYKPAK